MARLPQVGSDQGSWGTVLNDFLSVAHNTDGTTRDGIINVKAFGAKGDGTTDDTAAIQSALDAAKVRGQAVIFDAGFYRVTDTLTISNARGMTITGPRSGMSGGITNVGGAWLYYGGTAAKPMLTIANSSHVTWEGIGFFGNNIADGILIRSTNSPITTEIVVRELFMYRVGTGVYINDSGASTQSDSMIFESIGMAEIITNGFRTNSDNANFIRFSHCRTNMASSNNDVIGFNLQRGGAIIIDTCAGGGGQDFCRVSPIVSLVTLDNSQNENSTNPNASFLRIGGTTDTGNLGPITVRNCKVDYPIYVSQTSRKLVSTGNIYDYQGVALLLDGSDTRVTSSQDAFIGVASVSVTGVNARFQKIGEFTYGVPKAGAHFVGEQLWEHSPTINGALGWVCTSSGTPGTWKSFGTP